MPQRLLLTLRCNIEDYAYVCTAGSRINCEGSCEGFGYGIYDIASMVKVEGDWIANALCSSVIAKLTSNNKCWCNKNCRDMIHAF